MVQLDYFNINSQESKLHFTFYHKTEDLISSGRIESKWSDISLSSFDTASLLKTDRHLSPDLDSLHHAVLSLYQITRLAYEQSLNLQATLRPLIPHSTWAEAAQIARGSNRTFPSETRNISVLRLDIVNFTTLMDCHPLDQLLTALKAYLDSLTQIVYEHNGDVYKYLGDGFLSIFTSADAAVQAGYAIQKAVVNFNRAQTEQGGLVFACRIGVDSGPVVLTTIGSSQRQDRTVMGMPVNLAERLQARALPGSVWLSQETFNRLSDKSGYSYIGPVQVKGRQMPVIVYEKRLFLTEKGTKKMKPSLRFAEVALLLKKGNCKVKVMKHIRKILLTIATLLIIVLVMVAMPAPDTTAQSPAVLDEEGNILDPGFQHPEPGQFTPQDLGDVLNSFPNPLGLRGLTFRGGRLWGVSSSGVLYEMDADSGVVLSTVTISPSHNTSGLGFDTMRNVFIVTDAFADVILKVDPTAGTVIDSFSSPDGGPVGAAYDSTRDGYWISDWISNRIHLVNPDTGVEISSLSIPPNASRIAGTGYDPTNDVIMLHSRYSAETYLIDASDGSQVGVYPTPPSRDANNGFGAAIRAADLSGYLTHFDVATIFAVDLDLAPAPMVWKIYLPGIVANSSSSPTPTPSPPTPTPTATPQPTIDPADLPCLYVLNWWRNPSPPYNRIRSSYSPPCLMQTSVKVTHVVNPIGLQTGYLAEVKRQGRPNFNMNVTYIINAFGGVIGATVLKTYEGGQQYSLTITRFCPPVGQLTGSKVRISTPPYNGQTVTIGFC